MDMTDTMSNMCTSILKSYSSSHLDQTFFKPIMVLLVHVPCRTIDLRVTCSNVVCWRTMSGCTSDGKEVTNVFKHLDQYPSRFHRLWQQV